jgi:hypothetical protein
MLAQTRREGENSAVALLRKKEHTLKRLMMYIGLLLLTIMFSACTAAMDEDVQKLNTSREALRTCLAAHQSDPDACSAAQAMFVADQQTIETRASTDPTYQQSVLSGVLIGFAKGSENRRAQAAYQPMPAPNLLGQTYRITTPGDVVGQQVTVTPGP